MSKYGQRIKRILKSLPNSDDIIVLVSEQPDGSPLYLCEGKEYTEAEYRAAFPDWKSDRELSFAPDDQQ